MLAAGCARTGFPEGGPVDATPPTVATTSPADKATDVPPDTRVRIVFDEPLAPGAVSQVTRLLFVNPDKPETVTSVDGETIEIVPKEPFEPQTTYTVLLQPGVPDRRSNTTKEPLKIAFSTGGPLTLTLLKGTVAMAGKPAAGALVRAANRERGFGYRAFADSSGAFQLLSVALGTYDVTAWSEANGEEGFQFTLEPGDTASAAIERSGAGADLAFDLVVADTSAPRLVRAEPIAADGLTLSFSDTLDPAWTPEPARALLLRLPPEVAPRGTPLDSIPQPSVIGDTIPIGAGSRDTLEPKTVVLELASPLADSTAYAVRVGGVPNTSGLVSPDEPPFLLFRTRVLPDTTLAAPGDTTAAPGDTAGVAGDTTAVPGDTTAVPGDTTAVPGDTTTVPGDTTTAPGDAMTVPGGAPANQPAPPAAPDTLEAQLMSPSRSRGERRLPGAAPPVGEIAGTGSGWRATLRGRRRRDGR